MRSGAGQALAQCLVRNPQDNRRGSRFETFDIQEQQQFAICDGQARERALAISSQIEIAALAGKPDIRFSFDPEQAAQVDAPPATVTAVLVASDAEQPSFQIRARLEPGCTARELEPSVLK